MTAPDPHSGEPSGTENPQPTPPQAVEPELDAYRLPVQYQPAKSRTVFGASASLNDDESASAVPTSQAPGRRSGRVRQIWWTSVPIWSLCLLSCVPFLAFAVIQRRKRDWAVFAAYLAVTVALITAAGLLNNSNSVWVGVVGLLYIALGICAAIHACILFRPGRAQPSRADAAWRRNQEMMQGARNRIERRNHARHVVQTNPALARELRIGRPDLPRGFDDGGLVDVNRVPGAVLAAQLGLTQQEVTNVITARDKLGRFTGADELRDAGTLSPGRVDELRDLMIFS
jgi:hypothetical protein